MIIYEKKKRKIRKRRVMKFKIKNLRKNINLKMTKFLKQKVKHLIAIQQNNKFYWKINHRFQRKIVVALLHKAIIIRIILIILQSLVLLGIAKHRQQLQQRQQKHKILYKKYIINYMGKTMTLIENTNLRIKTFFFKQ